MERLVYSAVAADFDDGAEWPLLLEGAVRLASEALGAVSTEPTHPPNAASEASAERYIQKLPKP